MYYVLVLPDRRVSDPVHHHRGGQDQVLPGAERLLLRQGGHAQASPLWHVQVTVFKIFT